jgi:hypothetical protein
MTHLAKTHCASLGLVAAALCTAGFSADQESAITPGPSNLVWDSPSTGANGSMPLGNGEVGLNLWVEKNGELLFYVARTDAWSECCQLKKYPMFNAGSWTMRGAQFAPKDLDVWESADVVEEAPSDAVTWYHRNAHSIVSFTVKLQGLESVAHLTGDPLKNRTFGGWMSAAGFVKDGKTALRSAGKVTDFELKLVAYTAQTDSAGAWRQQTQAILKQSPSAEDAAKCTAGWWGGYWDRSWIVVEGDATSPRVTEAYALQRWVNACGGRGNYPIKFNGSIFTVDAKYMGKPEAYGPDWRDWGDCYWWQNTRLPYQPLPTSGDFDLMKPLFKFYENAAPLCKARAQIYHQVKGVYFPETMTVFGTYSNGDYGWDRRYANPKDVMCPAWQYCWQQGLELVGIMLDYYDYTEDDAFLAGELVPMARDVLDYFAIRFRRGKSGKIELRPTQMLETYRPQDILGAQGHVVGRREVINDTPTVAGLESVITRLLALPPDKMPPADRKNWQAMKDILPPVPLGTKDGKTFIRPAQEYPPNAWNIENGELYAVSPFRLFRIGKPNLEIGVNTYQMLTLQYMVMQADRGQDLPAARLAERVECPLQVPRAEEYGGRGRLSRRQADRAHRHATGTTRPRRDVRRQAYPAVELPLLPRPNKKLRFFHMPRSFTEELCQGM